MSFVTGTLVGFAIVGSLVKLVLDDEEGQRHEVSYGRGKYGRRALLPYKGKRIDIEYEWGDTHRKILRISLPSVEEWTLGR